MNEEKSNHELAREEINKRFLSKSVMPSSQAKEILGDIYSSHGIKRTPKSTDLSLWGIETKETFARDSRTKKTVRMIKIL